MWQRIEVLRNVTERKRVFKRNGIEYHFSVEGERLLTTQCADKYCASEDLLSLFILFDFVGGRHPTLFLHSVHLLAQGVVAGRR